MKLFRTPPARITPIEVPDKYGQRPALSELQAALGGQKDSRVVRSLVHLMMMRRTACSLSARGAARVQKSADFDLGGLDAMDELFSDLDALIEGAEPSDLLKQWFVEDEPGK